MEHEVNSYKNYYKNLFDGIPSYWDEIYSKGTFYGYHYQKRREHIISLLLATKPAAGMKVLDAGCGAGGYVPAYLGIDLNVVALDASDGMINKVKEIFSDSIKNKKIIAETGDIESLAYPDNTFDYVISSGVLMYLPTMEKALEETYRVLKNDGYAIINIDNHRNIAMFMDFPNIIKTLFKKVSPKQPSNKVENNNNNTSAAPVTKSYTPDYLKNLLNDMGFTIIQEIGHGFGPIRILGKRILPDKLDLFLYRLTQPLFKARLFGKLGFTYTVLVRKKAR